MVQYYRNGALPFGQFLCSCLKLLIVLYVCLSVPLCVHAISMCYVYIIEPSFLFMSFISMVKAILILKK